MPIQLTQEEREKVVRNAKAATPQCVTINFFYDWGNPIPLIGGLSVRQLAGWTSKRRYTISSMGWSVTLVATPAKLISAFKVGFDHNLSMAFSQTGSLGTDLVSKLGDNLEYEGFYNWTPKAWYVPEDTEVAFVFGSQHPTGTVYGSINLFMNELFE